MYPDIRVWLLAADGTHVQPLRRVAVTPRLAKQAVARGQPDATVRSEIIYTYPLVGAAVAKAVVLQVDDAFFIDGLP